MEKEFNDYLILYLATAPSSENVKKIEGIISRLSPSHLNKLDALRGQLNSEFKKDGLGYLLDVVYLPESSAEDLEARITEKSGYALDFILRLNISEYNTKGALSERMQKLKKVLNELVANLNNEEAVYVLKRGEQIFMKIPYSSFKESKRCGTARGVYGFLKNTINNELSKDYNDKTELSMLIGDDRKTTEWYEIKLMELTEVYWNEIGSKLIKTENVNVVQERKSKLAGLTEEEITKALQMASKIGESTVNIDKAVRKK